ncbi:MAG: hypothetical protein Q7U48_13565 [Hydrogenophaga sp.]|nr:hypothetical protein [Hydrogenophaga sp.]
MLEVDDRPALRARLSETLKKVPAKVNAGSHQMAVQYKKFHADATKVLNNDRSSKQLLLSTLQRCADYHAP